MKYFLSSICILLFLSSCSENEKTLLNTGIYKGKLSVLDQKEIPFIFEVTSPNSLSVFNAEEVIEMNDITYRNDSVYIKAAVFEGTISAKIYEDGSLKGYFKEESMNRIVPFSAEKGPANRFETSSANYNIDGVWEVVFSEEIEEDRYESKGIFKQEGDKVTGTFRTNTGDYRYLEGVVDGDVLELSTFDGAHSFLFEAKLTDSTMSGMFYSGNHFKEPFSGKRNANFELQSGDNLTFLKEGYERFDFEFKDIKGELVSSKDERFKDKMLVVQIMGSWCPNCLDESKFLTKFYKENKDQDFEIVALAFERAKTEEKALKNVKRLKERLGIDYTILLAYYGSDNKGEAEKKLPMLNQVMSYPTTIFIDKKGAVRKIHTGFNGPATGIKYEEFKLEFEQLVSELSSEIAD